jgi:hypothetical protein
MAKLKLHDERMLSLMDYVIESRHIKIKTEIEFLKSIGFTTASNIYKVRAGSKHFTLSHIQEAINKYHVNANYFFVKTAKFSITEENKTPAQILREVAEMIEKK